MAPSAVSAEELHTFHQIDRDVYARVTVKLGYDPIVSMRVVALWLWLELLKFPSLIFKIVVLPDDVVINLVDEAITCLKFLGTHGATQCESSSSMDSNLPKTQSFMEGKSFSLQFFRERKMEAIGGIARLVNDVCLKAMGDLVREAGAPLDELEFIANCGNRLFGGSDTTAVHGYVPVSQVMHPVYYGADRRLPDMCSGESSSAPSTGGSLASPFINKYWPISQHFDRSRLTINKIPADDRTMFLTFSRGYAVSLKEVWDFFSGMEPYSIVDVQMQRAPEGQQCMYARVILHYPTTMTKFFSGQEKAEFIINGKHIWGRRFIGQH